MIPYEDIPGFPLSRVESHRGRLRVGTPDGMPVMAMHGRFHRYEGYSLGEVTFPVRVMRLLGADTLVFSGAYGGLDVSTIMRPAAEAEPNLTAIVHDVVGDL